MVTTILINQNRPALGGFSIIPFYLMQSTQLNATQCNKNQSNETLRNT
ncbi:MAG: hypothetical protein J5680_04990 [Neisseriaceae bacterium]|nr:hypothetical protein [Neisseriaceae bacterium]MBR5676261.1 hypothetical protein [Neisseriaceae bacterium]